MFNKTIIKINFLNNTILKNKNIFLQYMNKFNYTINNRLSYNDSIFNKKNSKSISKI